MPKADVVFTAAMDEADDSDDEIEVIPFVKPPPVVIDLLESDEEGCEKKKKKSKKKKHKKDKQSRDNREQGKVNDESDSGSIADGTICDANNPTVSLPSVRPAQNDGSTSSGDGGRGDRRQELTSGQAEDSARVTSPVSRNVAGTGSVATTSGQGGERIAPSLATSPHVRLLDGAEPSLRFEKCNNAQSKQAVGGEPTMGDVMVGTSPLPPCNITSTPENQSPSEKRTKTKEKRSRGAGGRTRARVSSAAQRTNEEIVNFLTTLGIQMEPSAFVETPTPKKRRQPRKRKEPADIESVNTAESVSTTSGNDGLPLPASANSPASASGINAFVSVSHETSDSPSKKRDSPKGKRRRQAIIGDISDFEISFSNADLNSINTSIQSNVVFPGNDVQDLRPNFASISSSNPSETCENRSNMEEIIDAVAKGQVASDVGQANIDSGGPSPSETPKNSDFVTPSKSETESTEKTSLNPSSFKKTVSEAATPEPTPDSSVSMVSDEIKKLEKETPMASKESIPIPENNLGSTDTTRLKYKRDDLNKSDNPTTAASIVSQDSPSSPQRKKRRSGSPSSVLISKDSIPLGPVPLMQLNIQPPLGVLPPVVEARLEQPSGSGPISGVNLDASYVESDNHSSCFPTTWTQQMREYYGDVQNENFEIDDLWYQLSGNSNLWRAPNDMMPPPKDKRRSVRCERCKQYGHFARECGEKWKPPVCHMCGNEGHTSDYHSSHRRQRCSQAKCLNCGQSLAQYSQQCTNCLLQRHPKRCEMCNVVGHKKNICPDSWRRYHSITSQEEYETNKKSIEENPRNHRKSRHGNGDVNATHYKQTSSLFCCNCGLRGHSYYDCYENRGNPYHRHKPFVILETITAGTTVPTSDSTTTGPHPVDFPVPYDAQSSRSVVMNAIAERGSDLDLGIEQVETLQIRISNDLAVQKSNENQEKEDLSCNEKCVDLLENKNLDKSKQTDEPATPTPVQDSDSRGEIQVDKDGNELKGKPDPPPKSEVADEADEIIVLPLPPKPEPNVEIITIDDDDDVESEFDHGEVPNDGILPTLFSSPHLITSTEKSNRVRISDKSPPKSRHNSITLLASEWKLVTEEFKQTDNAFNQIASAFGVELVVSKETSSITVTGGSNKKRDMAKDNVLFWLERKSSKTDYYFLPRGYEAIRKAQKKALRLQMNNPGNKDKDSNNIIARTSSRSLLKMKKRALKLMDVPLHPSDNGKRKERKKRKRPSQKVRQANKLQSNANLGTPNDTAPNQFQQDMPISPSNSFFTSDSPSIPVITLSNSPPLTPNGEGASFTFNFDVTGMNSSNNAPSSSAPVFLPFSPAQNHTWSPGFNNKDFRAKNRPSTSKGQVHPSPKQMRQKNKKSSPQNSTPKSGGKPRMKRYFHSSPNIN